MITRKMLLVVMLLMVTVNACVEHLPARNGLDDSSIYLTKLSLTGPNPELSDSSETGWLKKVTVVQTSAPNALSRYVFPGLQSKVEYIQFRFLEDTLQVVDGIGLQHDKEDNRDDDLATSTGRVLFSFPGKHVDIKLRETLNGEKTNLVEENIEAPWWQRQMFKVNFEDMALDPVHHFGWIVGELVQRCVQAEGAHLVPNAGANGESIGSHGFKWSQADQAMSFVVEVNYRINGLVPGCVDMVSSVLDAQTTTVRYLFSFYRPETSDYTPEFVAEKAPVNKRFGAFQSLRPFRDGTSGLLGAANLLNRWNPSRSEPVTYYFAKGFPEKFKSVFYEIFNGTNRVLQEMGASLRFRLAEYDDNDTVREFGDLRYSFVVWHQSIDSSSRLLGYGPFSADPRTGETISANIHLYNIGYDLYRYMIETYLEDKGAVKPKSEGVAWENTSCEPGSTVAMGRKAHLRSPLFESIRAVLSDSLSADTSTSGAGFEFIPPLTSSPENFGVVYQRLLKNYRFAEPLFNQYVYEPYRSNLISQVHERMATEQEFQAYMNSITVAGGAPVHGGQLTAEGRTQSSLEFVERMDVWRRNHTLLHRDMQQILSHRNIYLFNADDAYSAISRAARRCTEEGFFESDEMFRERVIRNVVHNIGIHEFGHNLSLRHNFYGSVDVAHHREHEVSSSVMDYVAAHLELSSPSLWGAYDEAALTWIYGSEKRRAEVMDESYLYCTDEHRARSPLCRAHDFGVTPAEITLNAIESYDWMYRFRNIRAYRAFWDTSRYTDDVYHSIFSLLRMWYLGVFEWSGSRIQESLVKDDKSKGILDSSSSDYDEIAAELKRNVDAAFSLTMAFYDALVAQTPEVRDYQTRVDPFFGDIERIGIVVDKIFAVFAFMDLQEVYNYNPSIYTYLSMYDVPLSPQSASLARRVLNNFLLKDTQIYPWFRHLGLLLFARATNSNLILDRSLRDYIAVDRYPSLLEFEYAFPAQEREMLDEEQGVFIYEGEEYVLMYVDERQWYLVSNKSKSPISYELMRRHNEAVLGQRNGDLDNFGIKILVAYHELFNNFSGY